ncbi:MAG: LysR family transcriptional regulator [Gammaproteobacteria bacterium]|nr:LysR family transcriptional regulator [Gammaproteobacteria bacterium]
MNRTKPVVGLPTLTWLRAFEAAARTSSFSAAAAELNLTSGAIGYQIRALERHLGFALFERLPRGVRLTAMGVAYLPPVRKAFEELADSTIGLFGGDARAQITVHAPVSLAALWLAPHLPSFAAAHPSIDVRLCSVVWDNASPDESTDLEIRYGDGHWLGYRSERFLNQGILAVCSPTLRREANGETRGEAGSVALLARHPIHIMGYEDHWLSVQRELGLRDAGTPRGPTVDTSVAALELAANGMGCALAHRIFAAPYLRTGRLVTVIDREFRDRRSYFVVMPERARRVRREVESFRDWLLELAAAEIV